MCIARTHITRQAYNGAHPRLARESGALTPASSLREQRANARSKGSPRLHLPTEVFRKLLGVQTQGCLLSDSSAEDYD